MKKPVIIFLPIFLASIFVNINTKVASELPHEVAFAYKDVEWFNYVDFDVAMRTSEYPQAVIATKRIVGIEGQELMGIFKIMWEQFNPSKLQMQQEAGIPKIIHQIWLGSPVPEAFIPYMQSWIAKHLGRDWKYKLWTDEDVKDYELYNRVFYDETDNYGVKSDILKWEIIYNHGGVYIDTDFECLKALDALHYLPYDFYTAIQPLDGLFVQLGAALFAAKPGSPILKDCIETIKDDWHLKGAPTKSGPVHFTKSFYRTAGKNGLIEVAFPASYFYPLGCREDYIDREKWILEGAYGIHWWSKSWMPPKFRPDEFKKLDNDKSCESWNN